MKKFLREEISKRLFDELKQRTAYYSNEAPRISLTRVSSDKREWMLRSKHVETGEVPETTYSDVMDWLIELGYTIDIDRTLSGYSGSWYLERRRGGDYNGKEYLDVLDMVLVDLIHNEFQDEDN